MESIFSSKYTSVVKETSVSWADWKFVTERVGIPKHLRTGDEREGDSFSCRYSKPENYKANRTHIPYRPNKMYTMKALY